MQNQAILTMQGMELSLRVISDLQATALCWVVVGNNRERDELCMLRLDCSVVAALNLLPFLSAFTVESTKPRINFEILSERYILQQKQIQ